LIDTPIWQLPTFPKAPEYWRATPTDIFPNFGTRVVDDPRLRLDLGAHPRRQRPAHRGKRLSHLFPGCPDRPATTSAAAAWRARLNG
jgi:hypothetical protein